jgi:hypothetical protein
MFLHVRRTRDGVRLVGEHKGERGHRIQNPHRPDVDGVFVEWSWDGASLRLRNDRYGFYPIFYFANDAEIAVSDSIDSLLAAGALRDLDDAGLAAFLRLGHFLGDDTAFRAIRVLPPGVVLEWSIAGLKIAPSLVIARRCEMSRRAAMDAYIDLFRAAIARRGAPARSLVVPLSGGRDSRHIVLELCRQGMAPDECVTAPYRPGAKRKTDVEVAAQLCAALGIRHHVPPARASQKNAEQEKNRRTNYTTLEHGWLMPVVERLCSKAAVSYDGMAGDVLSAGHFLTRERHEWFERRQFRKLFQDMRSALAEPSIQQLLPAETSKRFCLDLALERFETECLPHLEAPNPVGSFSIFNRTRRVACLSAYALQPSVRYVFSPFLDNDLFDFLSSLPAELLVDHNFHTETIQYAYPEYARIPFAVTTPGTGYPATYQQYALEVAAELLFTRTPGLLRKRYVLPRLARCLIDLNYSTAAKWLGTLSIYLMQLERLSAPD